MKNKLLFVGGAYLLSACAGGGLSEHTASSGFAFAYAVDTVQVDSKDHLIHLQSYMNSADLSSDKKTLYNLNAGKPELEVIDLEELVIRDVLPLESEGPKGIGRYVEGFGVSDNGDFLITRFGDVLKLDSDRSHLTTVKLTSGSLSGDVLLEKEGFHFGSKISRDGNLFYAVYYEQGLDGELRGLALVDLNIMQLKKVPIEGLNRIKEFYTTLYQDGQPRMIMSEPLYVQEIMGKLLLSNTAFNEVWIYDIQMDSLAKKTYHSELTPNSKKGNFSKRMESSAEMDQVSKDRSKEVRFGPFFYDEKHAKFWRFSSDLDRMIGDSVVLKTVLTIFDDNLNQLHEEKTNVQSNSQLAFFKDGVFHSYINLEDELGFIRMKPTYGDE